MRCEYYYEMNPEKESRCKSRGIHVLNTEQGQFRLCTAHFKHAKANGGPTEITATEPDLTSSDDLR